MMIWGLPDYEFTYLCLGFGLAFVEEVAQRYGHLDWEALRNKPRYFRLVDQIGTILQGAGRALEGQEEEAWRRLKQILREWESSV